MHNDGRLIGEAYVSQVNPTSTSVGVAAPTNPIPLSQNNQEPIKKDVTPVKDWIRLPFIDTPFKARMAAVLIVELINNMTRDSGLRDLVLKEIRTSNRLQRKK
jgi:hypothetical protein